MQKIGDAEGGAEGVRSSGIAEVVRKNAVADQPEDSAKEDSRGHKKGEASGGRTMGNLRFRASYGRLELSMQSVFRGLIKLSPVPSQLRPCLLPLSDRCSREGHRNACKYKACEALRAESR